MTNMTTSQMGRRTFLSAAGAATAGAVVAGATGLGFDALGAAPAGAVDRRRGPGPGPRRPVDLTLVPVADQTTGLELIKLPGGFEYLSFGWTSDVMADGTPTPGAHDGMAAFRRRRPHGAPGAQPRAGRPAAPFAARTTYDPAADRRHHQPGVRPRRRRAGRAAYASLSGHHPQLRRRADAVGHLADAARRRRDDQRRRHPPRLRVRGARRRRRPTAVPLRPWAGSRTRPSPSTPRTGIVYLTEDAGAVGPLPVRAPPAPPTWPPAACCRWPPSATRRSAPTPTPATARPRPPSTLGRPSTSPTRGPAEPSTVSQGIAKGGAQFEPAARAPGTATASIYFVSTRAARTARARCSPTTRREHAHAACSRSPSADVLNAPDNICVSPRGGLVLCEDGSGREFMHGLTTDGDIFPLRREQRGAATGERKGYSATSPARSGAAPPSSPERQLAVRQHPEPGHHLRHHRAVRPHRPVGLARPAVTWSRGRRRRGPVRPGRCRPLGCAAMQISLEGKVALVTGASRGIGRAIAGTYAAAGAAVMLSSRKQDALEAAAADTAEVGDGGEAGLRRQCGRARPGRHLRGGHDRAVRAGRHPGQQRRHQSLHGPAHRHRPAPLRQDLAGQLPGAGGVGTGGLAGIDAAARRRHRQHRLDRRALGRAQHRALQRDQGGADPPHRAPWPPTWRPGCG